MGAPCPGVREEVACGQQAISDRTKADWNAGGRGQGPLAPRVGISAGAGRQMDTRANAERVDPRTSGKGREYGR